jgi:electron transport complex protein RnfG
MSAPARETPRIVFSMVVVCAIGAAVLGGVFAATDRYQRFQALRSEQRAIREMLELDSTATVLEVRQYLAEERREVVYQALPLGSAGAARQLVFTLAGALERQDSVQVAAGSPPDGLTELGRLFVARAGDRAAGFVVEGHARGYKNRIRFLVALTSDFSIAGVRVVEHEEDPGLGAEIATSWFEGQYTGRTADQAARLDVTRDPMPEDWRSALAALERTPAVSWRARHQALREREGARPIYAVTGATISSRALTDGVRATTDHIRRRWQLLSPYLGGAS